MYVACLKCLWKSFVVIEELRRGLGYRELLDCLLSKLVQLGHITCDWF